MTNLSPFTPGQAYAYNGQIIPSQQTLAPATAPNIAFRPACSQLSEVAQADGTTAYVLNLRSEVITMATFPTGALASRQMADFELDAMGACKIGGDVVPIVPVSSLPTPAIARPEVLAEQAQTALAGSPQSVGPNGLMVAAGLVICLVSLAGIGWIVWRGSKQKPTDSTTPNALDQLVALAKEAPKDER